MNDQAKTLIGKMVVQLDVNEFAEIVQQAVKKALATVPREDKLLTVEQVCEILNVESNWLYHHSSKLPFTRKVGGMLRFSANDLQRFIASAKFTVK